MESTPNDRQRFEELYRSTYPLIVAYCRRRLPASDAEDAVAQIYTVAWGKRAQLFEATEPLAWLYRVGFNTVSSTYRAKKRLRRQHDRAAHEMQTHELPADADIATNDDLDRALGALVALSARDQELVRLAAYEELTYAQIGIALGVSAGAARSKLYRARKRLREAFKNGSGGQQ